MRSWEYETENLVPRSIAIILGCAFYFFPFKIIYKSIMVRSEFCHIAMTSRWSSWKSMNYALHFSSNGKRPSYHVTLFSMAWKFCRMSGLLEFLQSAITLLTVAAEKHKFWHGRESSQIGSSESSLLVSNKQNVKISHLPLCKQNLISRQDTSFSPQIFGYIFILLSLFILLIPWIPIKTALKYLRMF